MTHLFDPARHEPLQAAPWEAAAARAAIDRIVQGTLQGVAIYLLDCIEGTDRFPTLDTF